MQKQHRRTNRFTLLLLACIIAPIGIKLLKIIQSLAMVHERPTSPHLSIYKPQISSTLSILHRATGVALFFVLAIITWWMILLQFSGFCRCLISAAECWLVEYSLYAASFCLFYHLCNGIRHLFWDMGKGFEIAAMNRTGWFTVVASIVLTITFWMCINVR